MYAFAEPWPSEASQVPRDDKWLGRELDRIWETFFHDIPRINVVEVSFARRWKSRLGLITLSPDSGISYIGMNSILRYPEVPDFVNTAILAHELTHYAHGFGSPLPRRYSHPHRGGVIAKELAARGLSSEHRAHQQWIQEHWNDLWTSRHRLRLVR